MITLGIISAVLAYLSVVSVWTSSVASSNAGWQTYGLRQQIRSSELTNVSGRTPTQVRITLKGATSNAALINDVFIGKAATAPNFDGNQKRVTFSGSNSVQLANSAESVSDWIDFTITEGNNYLISMGFASGSYNSASQIWTSGTSFYKNGDAANAGTTTVSGYTTYDTKLTVLKVETR